MAHALVMALAATEGSEDEAFTAFHRYFPGAPLLIDTYDTIAAAERLAKKMQSGELKQLAGIRIDSGDLVAQSQQIRQLLPGIPIMASGDLDEYQIAELIAAGACIDGYGLGTQLVTGSPVNGVYKLVEIDGIPVMKEAPGKASYPGRKQIWRQYENGVLVSDRLGLADQSPTFLGEPLLRLVMKQGQRLHPAEPLAAIAQRTAQSVASLPPSPRQLHQPNPILVEPSAELVDLADRTKKERRGGGEVGRW
jgi:nicotinate phosphoribosyltransferase